MELHQLVKVNIYCIVGSVVEYNFCFKPFVVLWTQPRNQSSLFYFLNVKIFVCFGTLCTKKKITKINLLRICGTYNYDAHHVHSLFMPERILANLSILCLCQKGNLSILCFHCIRSSHV